MCIYIYIYIYIIHVYIYAYVYVYNMNTVVFESDAFDVLFPIAGIILDPTDRRCTTMVTTGWYKISATTKAAEVEVKCDEEEKSCFDRGHDMS